MAMTYNTLVAPKGTAGSLLNWIGYSKVDVATAVDELQSLIYSILRVREMRFQWVFGIPATGCKIALPARFLDPIGRLTDNFGSRYLHTGQSEVVEARMYDTSLSGLFGTNAFTTGPAGSNTVTIVQGSHRLNQGSDITIAGASVLDGVNVNGTSLVTSVFGTDQFAIVVPDAASIAGNVLGGNSSTTYTANSLIAGQPLRWSIWDGFLQFDAAFDTAKQFRLMCYKSLPLLSASNPNNFLTDRYPNIIREAGLAYGASFMKDDNEYTKHLTQLEKLCQSAMAEGDFEYRGADLYAETP